MVNKNIQMKKRDGNSWNNLFPVTLNENIFNDSGQSLNEQMDDLNHMLQNEFDTINSAIKIKTTMDYINGTFPIHIGDVIETHGFHEYISDKIFKYKVETLSGTEEWTATNKGYQISKLGEIRIDDKKLIYLFDRELKMSAFGVTGNNDDVIVQSVFNLAIDKVVDIEIDMNIHLSSSIIINRNAYDRTVINIFGSGEIIKNSSGYLFDCTLTRSEVGTIFRQAGNFRFDGITFRSTEDSGLIIMNSDKLIRFYFNNCDFFDVDHLFYASLTDQLDGRTTYAQTIYIVNCTIVGGKGWFIQSNTLYDFSLTHSVVEHRHSVVKCISAKSVRITDNVIEGLHGEVYEGVSSQNLNISDNYFEYNSRDNDLPYIKLKHFNGHTDSITMINNHLILPSVQIDNTEFYPIHLFTVPLSFSFSGNYSNGNLIKLDHEYTITSNFLKTVFSNLSNKFVLNKMKISDGYKVGSENLLKKTTIPFTTEKIDEAFTLYKNPGNQNAEEYSDYLGRLNATVRQSSTKLGFETKESVYLNVGVDYVIGLQGTTRMGTNQPRTYVHVVDSDGVIVKQFDLNWQLKNGTVDINNEFILPFFRIASNGEHKIRVFMENSSGLPVNSGIILTNLVINRGHIPSF